MGFAKVCANKRKKALRRELKRILPIIIEKYRPEKVILLGSLVSGQVGEWSDLDLAIVKKTKKKFVDRLVEVARLAHSYEAVDLDQYYRPTRYPDAVVGTLPTGLPGEKHAKEALKIAKQVYDKTCETRDHK